MGVGMIYNTNVLYLSRSLLLTDADKAFWVPVTSVVIGLAIVVSTIPASRLSDRIGRKKVIYGSCGLAMVGLAMLVVAPGVLVAEVGILLVAVGAGAFLAVDWALMTDIIPKASSGRYMGLSNVATASSGALALVVGGVIIDVIGGPQHDGSGPRTAFAVAIAFYVLAAICLRPVDERRREDRLMTSSRRRRPAEGRLAVAPDPPVRPSGAPGPGTSGSVGAAPARCANRRAMARQVAGRSQRMGSSASHSHGTVAHNRTR